MYSILEKRRLNDSMTLMVVEAPFIARKAKAGQFIILRVNEFGERIPLTIADYDREKGTITIIFQKVGKTTLMLDQLNEGDAILDFIGPLGMPSELEGYKKAAVIGGGAGCAIAYPQAKALHQLGTSVDMIAGFRNREIIILEDEMRSASDRLVIMTDDNRAAGDDAGRVQPDEEIRDQDDHQHEPDHDRRNGNVRRMPPDRGWRDQIRLRGRPRFRRAQGGLRRGDPALQNIQKTGRRSDA